MFLLKKTRLVLIVGLLLVTGSATAGNRPDLNVLPVSGNHVIGEPFLVNINTPDSSIGPAVAYNSIDHEFLVVYQYYPLNKLATEIHAQRVSQTGKLLSNYYVADGYLPDVAYNSAANEYLIVWEVEPSDIKGKRVNANGSYQGNPFDIRVGSGDQSFPAVTFNNHADYQDYLVVWDELVEINPSQNQVTYHIYGQRVAGRSKGGDGGGELIGSQIAVATNPYPSGPATSFPDIAYNLNRNEFLVVYTSDPSHFTDLNAPNIGGTRVTAKGQVLNTSDIDSSANAQFTPSVASSYLNPETPYFVVFHDHDKLSGNHDVRGWFLDNDAHSIISVHIAAGPGLVRWEPVVASSGSLGDYMVVWAEGRVSGNEYDLDIYGRRVSQAGETGPPFSFSERGLSAQGFYEQFPAVAVGSPVALAVWTESNDPAGINNVLGHLLGYQISLPMILK